MRRLRYVPRTTATPITAPLMMHFVGSFAPSCASAAASTEMIDTPKNMLNANPTILYGCGLTPASRKA